MQLMLTFIIITGYCLLNKINENFQLSAMLWVDAKLNLTK